MTVVQMHSLYNLYTSPTLSFGETICHLRLVVTNLHKVGKTSIHAIVSFVTGITAVSQTYTGNEYLPFTLSCAIMKALLENPTLL